MKSSNPSFRRLAFAAAVLAAGNFAFAQSTTGTSAQDASNTSNSSMQNSNDHSGSNSNWSATTSNSNPSSSNSNYSDNSNRNSNDQSSMSSNDRSSSSNKDKLSWGDRRFVKKAAEDGQAEVAIAQLAAQKATNPDVRQFAQQMVDDHTQANQELMNLASQKNVKLDQDDATKDRAYRHLSQTSGNDFDREFVDHMVDEHEKDVRLFQKESQRAKDEDIKQFASSTLPKLQEHLQHVQQLQQSIMPTGNAANSGYSNSSNSNNSTSSNKSTGSGNSNSTNGSMSGSNATNSSGTSGATGSSTSSTR